MVNTPTATAAASSTTAAMEAPMSGVRPSPVAAVACSGGADRSASRSRWLGVAGPTGVAATGPSGASGCPVGTSSVSALITFSTP